MINPEDLIRKVRELAENSPDCVYNGVTSCSYTQGECSNGTVGCIMGQAVLAVDPSQLYMVKMYDTNSFHNLSLNLLFDRPITEEEVKWCSNVQGIQDDGECWKKAVDEADGWNGEINE